MRLTRTKLRQIILETIQDITEGRHDDSYYSDVEFDRRRDVRAMGFDPTDPMLADLYPQEDDDYDPYDPTRPEYKDFERDQRPMKNLDPDPEPRMPKMKRQLSLPFE
jgi:hypothetical protein